MWPIYLNLYAEDQKSARDIRSCTLKEKQASQGQSPDGPVQHIPRGKDQPRRYEASLGAFDATFSTATDYRTYVRLSGFIIYEWGRQVGV